MLLCALASREVPLDAALRSCEQGGSARRWRVLRNGATHSGKRGEKTGGDEKVAGHGTILPAARLFPFPRPVARTIPFGQAALTGTEGLIGQTESLAREGRVLLNTKTPSFPLVRPAVRTIPFGQAALTKGGGTDGCHRADGRRRM